MIEVKTAEEIAIRTWRTLCLLPGDENTHIDIIKRAIKTYGNEKLEQAAREAEHHAKNFESGMGKWVSNDIADQIRSLKVEGK